MGVNVQYFNHVVLACTSIPCSKYHYLERKFKYSTFVFGHPAWSRETVHMMIHWYIKLWQIKYNEGSYKNTDLKHTESHARYTRMSDKKKYDWQSYDTVGYFV